MGACGNAHASSAALHTLYSPSAMADLPPDTEAFVARLAKLRHSASTDEERIAASLFDWNADVTVARAPGRMDVMGERAHRTPLLFLCGLEFFGFPTRTASEARSPRLPVGDAGGIADYSGCVLVRAAPVGVRASGLSEKPTPQRR